MVPSVAGSLGEECAGLFDQLRFVLVTRRIVADHEPPCARFQGRFRGVRGGRMPPVFGRPLLRGGVGRLVVHQIDPLQSPAALAE